MKTSTIVIVDAFVAVTFAIAATSALYTESFITAVMSGAFAIYHVIAVYRYVKQLEVRVDESERIAIEGY